MLQTKEQTITFSLFSTVQPASGGAPARITLSQHGPANTEPGTANVTQPIALETRNEQYIARLQQQGVWKGSVIPGMMAPGTTPPDTILVPLSCKTVGGGAPGTAPGGAPGGDSQRVTFGAKGYGPGSSTGIWLAGDLSLAFNGEEGGGHVSTNDYTFALTPDNG